VIMWKTFGSIRCLRFQVPAAELRKAVLAFFITFASVFDGLRPSAGSAPHSGFILGMISFIGCVCPGVDMLVHSGLFSLFHPRLENRKEQMGRPDVSLDF